MLVSIWSHFRDETWTGDVPLEAITEVSPSINEGLFRLFNRVEAGDGLRLEAWGYLLPSLSVGDRVTWGGQTYEVAPLGFVEVA